MQSLLFFIVFILSCIPMFIKGVQDNFFLLLIHILIAGISSLSLFMYRKNSFSIYKIIHLFFLFFLCIAPISQYKFDVSFWGAKKFSDIEYIYISFVVLCILLLYNLIYYIVYKNSKCSLVNKLYKKISNPIVVSKKLRKKEFFYFVCLDVVILFLILYTYKFNLFYLFIRGGVTDTESLLDIQLTSLPQSVTLIIGNFFRPMAAIILLVAYKLKANKIMLLVLGIFTLIIAFPTSMPRFSAAAMYIPIFLSFSKTLRRPNIFVFSFVLGLLIIFPFLNNFRYLTSNTNIEFGLDFEMFLEGHFDSYAMFGHVLTENVITYGNQLLGTLFFWVPRSIWPSKAIGSGAFLADKFNLELSNISCCFFGEGYINFGFVGILIFTVFIAWFSASFDKIYWNSQRLSTNDNAFLELIYFTLLGLLFFMMRGDLMSSFSFTLGYICSILFLYYFLFYRRKYTFYIIKQTNEGFTD